MDSSSGKNVTGGDDEEPDLTPDALELIERQRDRCEAVDVGALADGIEPLTLEHRL